MRSLEYATRERKPEDRGPTPAPAPRLQDWRPTGEDVDLALLARWVLEVVGHLWPPPLQAPDVALHGQVAVRIAVELSQVLPDPLRSQPPLQPCSMNSW